MHTKLLLLPILASLQLLPSAANGATVDTGCPQVMCGNLTITYPFWLGGRDQSSCGPPAFRLTCNDTASGPFLSSSYIKVLGFDYGRRSLVAVHALLAADAACTVMFNVSSAFAITDRFSISRSNRELYVLSRCRERLPPPGSVPVINCRANSSGMYAYLGGSYGTGQTPANNGSCELSLFPVLGSDNNTDMTAANYRRLIAGGFLLEWEPVGDCNTCKASGGQCRYDANTAVFACLCSDGGMRPLNCDGKNRGKLALIVSLSAAASLVFACLAWLMYRHRQKFRSAICGIYSGNTKNEEETLRKCESLALKRYKYSELKKITKSFEDELGEGGCGVVFKGSLEDSRTVAVKLLKASKGNREDFLNEVMSISRTSHVNIVSLLGFCLEGPKRALVYEYMPNGSLEKYIYSESSKLAAGWEMLLKIAIGIARGLEYLHQGCNTRIIHFDIKPRNILLDHEFCPKIADFGLAKLCHLNESILSMAEARGTIGFIAPEVFSRGFGVVSTKSDVYSYGMLLLEMVKGRNNLKGIAGNFSETFFPHWVYDRLVSEMQYCEVGHGTEEIVRKMTIVGLWCIQMTPETRPSMSRVIEMLERSISELEMPPKPFLCSPIHSTNVSSIKSVNFMILLLLLLLLLLCSSLSLIAAAIIRAEADQSGSECSPRTCGNLTISYPFGFVPEQETDTKCGRPGFEVHCSNNTPFLGYYRRKYRFQILDIFYGNGSLIVADVHKLDDFQNSTSKGCHVMTTNTSSKVGLPFSVSSVNLNLIFYNCTAAAATATAVRRDGGIVETKCLGGNTLVRVGGHYSDSSSDGQFSVEGCGVTVVPVMGASGEVNASRYEELISDGFLLTWQPPSGKSVEMPPLQLLLLLVTITFLILPAPASSSRHGCSPTSSCGDLTISYPFWLEQPGQPPCGSPPFQLNCNGSRAYLTRSVYGAYRVVNIFTGNNSFHVVDENLQLQTGCPAPGFNISDGIWQAPFIISKSNSKLHFLSCNRSLPVSPPGYRLQSCDNNFSFVRLAAGDGDELHGGIPLGCNFTVVPILERPNESRDGYVGSMRGGFLLEWAVVSGDCPQCVDSGGECTYGDKMKFACNCSDGMHPDKCGEFERSQDTPLHFAGKSRRSRLKLILIVSMSATASLILTCLVWITCRHKENGSFFTLHKYVANESKIEEILKGYNSLAPKRYNYSELKKITGSFKDKLGQGGYGMVFKGILQDGRMVAVKLLTGTKGNGEEFLNEVISIGRTSHVNIVSLLGFCLQGSKRALVYEYMVNGSLDKYIYSEELKNVVGWEKLRQIAIGIARGLEYLHCRCNTRIIHFDIKPQNILLDGDFCPKVADFGLAKLCHLKDSALSMAEARGTIGFIAPEVFSRGFGVVSTKSDVYSYGMLLLELVGGKRHANETTSHSSETYFPNRIYDCLVKDLQTHVVMTEVEEITKLMTIVGLWCIQTNPGNRPSISRVIEMLENNINELEVPPKPFLS
uniref:non-specific serine/threonine protein kinase n=1 Tax=Leersia perrieri TaxID=77586 RepID=A0A0D9UWI5_9ORYZ